MTGIPAYSTTAASNVQANTGINWDEGMAPAAVNNSARQNMADTRAAFNDLVWFQYGKGDTPAYIPVYVSSTQFKVAGVDVSSVYHVGRRVKVVGSSTGTIYGSISTVAFSTDTTVTVTWDSGSLSNEVFTAVYLSQIPVTGKPVPASFAGGISATGGLSIGDAQAISWPGTHTQIVQTVGSSGSCNFDVDNSINFRVGGATSFLTALTITSGGLSAFQKPAVLAPYAYNALPTATVGGRIFVTGTGQSGFGTQLDGTTSGGGSFPAFADGTHWFIG